MLTPFKQTYYKIYCVWEWIADSLHLCPVYHKCNLKYTSKQTLSQLLKMENKKYIFTCIHQQCNHLWIAVFLRKSEAQVKGKWTARSFAFDLILLITQIWTSLMISAKKGDTCSLGLLSGQDPLIDSHCVANSVSRKWSTHMDSRIHRAFPRKRYKDNKLYWQNTYSQGSQVRDHFFISPLSLSVFHPVRTDDHLQLLPSFYAYVLPLSCNQFSLSPCLLLSY